MIKRTLSVLPLLFFIALILLAGYGLWPALRPSEAAGELATAPTPARPASPPATKTATPSATPSLTPTPSLTSTATAAPASAATPVLAASPPPVEPPTLVWVQTNNNPVDPVHTLGLRGPGLDNPTLQEYAAAPALAPQGQKLAFFSESSLSGLDTGIWIVEIGTGRAANPQRLADMTNIQNIAWSPDGDKLAYEIVVNPFDPPEQWRSQVKVVRADPAEGYVELSVFDGLQPAWSPDGRQLVAQTCLGSMCGLFLIDCVEGQCDHKNAEQLTADLTDSYPTWSVAGQLAFSSRREGTQDIYLLDLTDRSILNLTRRPNLDITPVFSADGRRIYFRTASSARTAWQIQAITLDSARQAVQAIDVVRSEIGGDDKEWGLTRPAVR